jgi:hypothetical protein
VIEMRIRMFSLFAALCATMFAAGASPAPAAEPVAMVTDLQGKVDAGAGAAVPAILASVNPGATLNVAEGGALVVVYFGSGKEYAFKGPSQVRFGASAPEMVSGAAPTMRDPLMGKVAGAGKIKPVGKIQAAVVMRGANEKSKIKFDTLAGTRVLEPSPEFRWQGPGEGLTYSFELSDEGGAVMFEQAVGGTSFKLPDSVQLKPGAKYTWVLDTKLADGKTFTNAADFTIASTDMRADVEAVRPAANAPLSERVTYAAWLDQLQFHDEARKYWKELAAARSGDANLNQLAGQ